MTAQALAEDVSSFSQYSPFGFRRFPASSSVRPRSMQRRTSCSRRPSAARSDVVRDDRAEALLRRELRERVAERGIVGIEMVGELNEAALAEDPGEP
jgi:hypothetical protein